MTPGPIAEWSPDVETCAECGCIAITDQRTNLCRPCWRVWRFLQDVLMRIDDLKRPAVR